MSVVVVLEEIGGVASRATLVGLTSRAAVDRALASGDIVADARGRYALPAADAALRAAHRLRGVLSHYSAAVHHGWEVKEVPATPHVLLPRNRKLATAQATGVRIHRADLGPDDLAAHATSKRRTIADCLRAGPFDAALCVADSALRHEDITGPALVALARDLRGPGSALARSVARQADGRAANPFESVLRAIALTVDGLRVVPQVPVGGTDFLGTPDLVDADLRIVLEADSFAWHGDRVALRRDARRYNSFVVAGWLVLRFAWEDVMHYPLWVRGILEAAVRERTEQAICPHCAA